MSHEFELSSADQVLCLSCFNLVSSSICEQIPMRSHKKHLLSSQKSFPMNSFFLHVAKASQSAINRVLKRQKDCLQAEETKPISSIKQSNMHKENSRNAIACQHCRSLWCSHIQSFKNYMLSHGRWKVHEPMLVIWAAQPGPNGQLSCLHSFKIF